MSVINIQPRAQYTYSTSSQYYTITFDYTDRSTVKCMINDQELTYGTHYEIPPFDPISLASEQLKLHLLITPESNLDTVSIEAGDTITIYRETPIDQQAVFPQNAKFSSQKITECLDKLTILIQELDDTLSSCVRLSKEAPIDFNVMLPIPTANQVLQWNSEGTQLINYDLRGEIIEYKEDLDDAFEEYTSDLNTAFDDYKETVNSNISDISTTASSAVSTANTASTKADTAISTANTASTNASAAVSTANTASTNASSAVSTANSAASTASTASTTASNALSTANTAKNTAETAASTASTALTNSQSAISTAESATSTANTAATNAATAISTANTASTNASNAVSTANTASTNASNAVSTANTASTNASNAVSTANAAKNTADTASEKVDAFGEDIASVLEAAEKINELEEAIETATTAATNASTAATNASTAATNATNAATTATQKAQEATAAVAAVKQADWNESDSDSKAYIKNKPNLSTVATSGSYNDLDNKPTIPDAQIQADWDQTDNTLKDYIKNKPTIPTVPTTLSSFTDDLGTSPTHSHSQYLTSHQDISGKENTSNKTTSLSSSSTDTQYPSAKVTYDTILKYQLFQNKTILSNGTINLSNDISIYELTPSANVTISFNTTNITFSNSTTFTFELCINMETIKSITFPTVGFAWMNGEAPDLSSTGVYYFAFRTRNSGTNWYGSLEGKW